VLKNLALLDASLDRHRARFSWTRPSASPIEVVRVHGAGDAAAFFEEVVAETGVLLLPGSVYDEPEHVRVGYGRANMPEVLARFEQWLDTRS
jgi:aspartate/methionine/tyrosine aminotransferase